MENGDFLNLNSSISAANGVSALIQNISDKQAEETQEKSAVLYRINADTTRLKRDRADNEFRGRRMQIMHERQVVPEHKYLLFVPK